MSFGSYTKSLCMVVSIALIYISIGSPAAFSASTGTSILGSKHDFSMSNAKETNRFAGFWMVGAPTQDGPLIDEICVFCHTPHAAETRSDYQTNSLLWNRIWSARSYNPYTSSTSTLVTGKPTGISMMCMSCHDGVTSIAVNVGNNINNPTLLNIPNAAGVSNQISLDPRQASQWPNGVGAIGEVYKGNQTTGGWGANIGEATPTDSKQIDMSNDHPVSFTYTIRTGYLPVPDGGPLRLFNGRIECATCHSVHNPSIEPFLAMSNAQSQMCRTCHEK